MFRVDVMAQQHASTRAENVSDHIYALLIAAHPGRLVQLVIAAIAMGMAVREGGESE